MPQNPDELGALWIKSGKKGEYMTGTIGGQEVVVWRNDRKQGNQPDWRVMKSKPREATGHATTRSSTLGNHQPDPDDFTF